MLRRGKAVEMKFGSVSTKALYFLLPTKIYAVKLWVSFKFFFFWETEEKSHL